MGKVETHPRDLIAAGAMVRRQRGDEPFVGEERTGAIASDEEYFEQLKWLLQDPEIRRAVEQRIKEEKQAEAGVYQQKMERRRAEKQLDGAEKFELMISDLEQIDLNSPLGGKLAAIHRQLGEKLGK